jgi:agmatine deiminase
LAITWRAFPEILTQIVLHAALEVKVVIFCNDESVKTTAEIGLQVAGANMANVEFVVTPTKTIWIRDYGPNCVYKNDVEALNFIDWVYNRPRPEDDVLPVGAAAYFGVPLYSTTENPERLVNTGGNFMSDGHGTAFASKLILGENAPGNQYSAGPHTESEIDAIMEDYMGINRYIKMETLPFDGIHHIDMHMRLLDEETLLVGQYPNGISDGPQIEANLEYVIDNFNSYYGTPYKR